MCRMFNRIGRGEDVPGGLNRPKTREEFEAELHAAAFTKPAFR